MNRRNTTKRRYIPGQYKGNIQRDERFDNVRGMLILLVVIGHFLMPLYQTRFITGLFHVIYVFHMPCFVLVSGYYSKSVYRDGRFKWGKIVQLLWIYFLYENVVNITEGLLDGYIPIFPNYFNESGAPWYVLVMAYYYALVPLFYKMASTRKKKAFSIVFMVVFICFFKYLVNPGSFLALDRAISFMPYFYIGYCIDSRTVEKYLLWGGKIFVEIATVIMLLIVFVTTYDFLMRFNLVIYGADYARYGASNLPFAWLINLVWYAAAITISAAFIGGMPGRRMFLLTNLGRNTLSIYFIHRPVRDLLQYMDFFTLINPHSKVSVILYILSLILLTEVFANPLFSSLFSRIRRVFDPLLEKAGAL